MARRAAQPDTPERGWFEVYPELRNNPPAVIEVPLGSDNRTAPADMVCFRYAPAFPRDELTGGAFKRNAHAAWGALIEYRNCAFWCDYNPGHDPKDHMTDLRLQSLEEDRRTFQLALDKGGRRLVVAGLIVGLAQVLTMTPDSFLYKVGLAIARLFSHLLTKLYS